MLVLLNWTSYATSRHRSRSLANLSFNQHKNLNFHGCHFNRTFNLTWHVMWPNVDTIYISYALFQKESHVTDIIGTKEVDKILPVQTSPLCTRLNLTVSTTSMWIYSQMLKPNSASHFIGNDSCFVFFKYSKGVFHLSWPFNLWVNVCYYVLLYILLYRYCFMCCSYNSDVISHAFLLGPSIYQLSSYARISH